MFEKLLAKRHISQLDLSSVRQKACEKLGWNNEKAEQAELEYKRFLYVLAHKRPEEMISPPTIEVDEFWHQHILDTPKYRRDCQKIFGQYMDHTPGLGMQQQAQADTRRDEIYSTYNVDSMFFDSGSGYSNYPSDYATSSAYGNGDSSHHHGSHASDACHSSGEVSGAAASGHDGGSSCGDSGTSDGGAGDGGSCSDGGSSCGGGDGGGSCGGGGCGGS